MVHWESERKDWKTGKKVDLQAVDYLRGNPKAVETALLGLVRLWREKEMIGPYRRPDLYEAITAPAHMG
jgi:hypothetical protein